MIVLTCPWFLGTVVLVILESAMDLLWPFLVFTCVFLHVAVWCFLNVYEGCSSVLEISSQATA